MRVSLTLEFKSAEGQLARTTTDGTPSYAKYVLGDTLPVFYDAQDPSDARVDLFSEHWFAPLLLGALGGVLTLIGWIIRSRSIKA